jgi:hypothetical protein
MDFGCKRSFPTIAVGLCVTALAACGDGASSSGRHLPHDAGPVGTQSDAAAPNARPASHDERDAMVSPQPPDDIDAGQEPQEAASATSADRPRSAAEECQSYKGSPISFSGYADDFGYPDADTGKGALDGKPDVALVWTAPGSGVYLVNSLDAAVEVWVLRGKCGGTLAPFSAVGRDPVAGSEASFVADAGEQYTFVLNAPSTVTQVDARVELACDDPDATCATEATMTTTRACGARLWEDSEGVCVPLHQPGKLDDRCPSSTFLDQLEPGCCRPDGECGQLDAALGCHLEAQRDWKLHFYCDKRAQPNPPATFECSWDHCRVDTDCCNERGGDYIGFCGSDGHCNLR